MYHIVASDLDGTLLSPDDTLSLYTKETLKFLVKKKKIHFIFATGRHYMDVLQICNNLEISTYMITSNGARVHDSEGNLIFNHDLDHDIALYLFEIAKNKLEVITNIYRENEWFVNRYRPNEIHSFKGTVFSYSLHDLNLLSPKRISKIFFTSKNSEVLLSLERTIKNQFGNRVNVSFSALTCLEVIAGGISKGYALEKVAKRLGYNLKDCLSFGDGMNDAEMLSMSGKGCIMGNAHCRLKNLYPNLEVIGTNADNAVPRYLRKLYMD